jgi:hypothetical protein
MSKPHAKYRDNEKYRANHDEINWGPRKPEDPTKKRKRVRLPWKACDAWSDVRSGI